MTRNRGKVEGVRIKKISFLNYDLGKSTETEHNKILAIVVDALYNAGYRRINYDHIKEIHERSDITLMAMGRKWDIMIALENNKYAAIEIKMLRETEIEEVEEEPTGVIYTCLNCGSYLWSDNKEEINQFDELLSKNVLECPACGSHSFNRREKDGDIQE